MGNSAYSFHNARSNIHVVGTKDGANDTFTMPFSESYLPASLEVFLNGQLINPDTVTKNGPGYTTFTLTDILPISTDVLTASYSVA